MASGAFSLPNQFIITQNFSSTPPPHSQGGVRFRPSLRVSAVSATVDSPYRTTTQTSLYDVLGIQMGATKQEIKSAYRRLARIVHPDVIQSKNNTSSDEFMRVHSAYTTLSDPEQRANYDRILFRGSRSSATGFSNYTRRNWESDQCW